MPVMMPAAAMLSSYMPNAASCENSRNGVPGSSSARMRSRGSSLPRPTCLARAASPPPCSIVATLARRSATCASTASRFAANVASRGLSLDSIVAMQLLASLEHGQPRGEQHEERADRSLEKPHQARALARAPSGARRDPRDRKVDEQAVDVEQRAQ